VFRSTLEARAASEGWQALQGELAAVDPESAARIDPKNVRRVIRALEVFHATGTPFSAFQPRRDERLFTPVLIGLHVERSELQRRIEARIDAWVAAGFLEEVRGLLDRGFAPSLPAMSGIGYREASAYLRNELTIEQATQQMKVATRQYAKRQLTWFKRDDRIHWLDATSRLPVDEVLAILRAAHV
jgi:tRNA dimethylallyltransferase